MKKVNLNDSYALFNFKQSIGKIRNDMQARLALLEKAFADACERWKDKNAQTCDTALAEHAEAMHAAFTWLERMESALSRLFELAQTYENM